MQLVFSYIRYCLITDYQSLYIDKLLQKYIVLGVQWVQICEKKTHKHKITSKRLLVIGNVWWHIISSSGKK